MDMSKDEIPSLNIETRISWAWEIAGSEGVEFKHLTYVKLFNEDSGSRILDPTNKNRIPDPDPQHCLPVHFYLSFILGLVSCLDQEQDPEQLESENSE
jgi:hypothetical protein